MVVSTPQGRQVLVPDGDPDAMAAQGSTLIHMGELMDESGAYARAMSTSTTAGVGFSIDSIRDIAGQCSGDLQTAAMRYERRGSALNVYADAFADVQARMRVLVPEAEELDRRRAMLQDHVAEVAERLADRSQVQVTFWSCSHAELVFLPPPAPISPEAPDAETYFAALEDEVEIRSAELASVEGDLEACARTYDAAFDDWERATVAAIGSLEHAHATSADTSEEQGYLLYARLANGAGLASDIIDQVSGTLASTVVGAPYAVLLQAPSKVLGHAEVMLHLGKALFPIDRAEGQAASDRSDIAEAVLGLLPFSGYDADGDRQGNRHTPGEIADAMQRLHVQRWGEEGRERPYVPPRRVQGEPEVSTYAKPRVPR